MGRAPRTRPGSYAATGRPAVTRPDCRARATGTVQTRLPLKRSPDVRVCLADCTNVSRRSSSTVAPTGRVDPRRTYMCRPVGSPASSWSADLRRGCAGGGAPGDRRARLQEREGHALASTSRSGARPVLNPERPRVRHSKVFVPRGLLEYGGGGTGIRTQETLSRPTVFKTAAFNHSAIPPREIAAPSSYPVP